MTLLGPLLAILPASGGSAQNNATGRLIPGKTVVAPTPRPRPVPTTLVAVPRAIVSIADAQNLGRDRAVDQPADCARAPLLGQDRGGELRIRHGCIASIDGGSCDLGAEIKLGSHTVMPRKSLKKFDLPGRHSFTAPGIALPPPDPAG